MEPLSYDALGKHLTTCSGIQLLDGSNQFLAHVELLFGFHSGINHQLNHSNGGESKQGKINQQTGGKRERGEGRNIGRRGGNGERVEREMEKERVWEEEREKESVC